MSGFMVIAPHPSEYRGGDKRLVRLVPLQHHHGGAISDGRSPALRWRVEQRVHRALLVEQAHGGVPQTVLCAPHVIQIASAEALGDAGERVLGQEQDWMRRQ